MNEIEPSPQTLARRALDSAIDRAASERWALDRAARESYFETGKRCAVALDISRWEPLVKGQGHETAIACAIEASLVFVPDCSIREAGKRAIGATREGVKSQIYIRLLALR